MARWQRSRRAALVPVFALLAAFGASLATPEPASAYTSLFRKFGKPAYADPCRKLGVGDDGGLVVRQWKPPKPSIKRYVALLCGPRVNVPATSLYLVDDQIRRFGHKPVHPHAMYGGASALSWNKSISTKRYGYLKGPHGSAPAVTPFPTAQDIQKLATRIKELFAITLAAEEVICLLGAIATEGEDLPLCLEILIMAGAKQLTERATFIAIAAEVFLYLVKSRSDMSNSDWFYWASDYGLWNMFGDIAPRWINPSIALTGCCTTTTTRIGVVFSNVGLDQGPNFSLPAKGARARRDPQFRRLARFMAFLRAHRGRTLVGTWRNDRLLGGPHHNHMHGRRGHDRLYGRGGADPILQGGFGNDRIYGGPGDDNIDGHRGRDRLFGGPGNDQIIDLLGRTAVFPGRGANLVIVRDGRGDDVVRCHPLSRGVIRADPGDVVGRRCRQGRPIKVFRGGPLMRIGRGYGVRRR